MLKLEFIFLIICLFHLASNYVSCFFSTKTAYLDSFTPYQLNYLNKTENYEINGCVPEQIYILLRHGSRYPSTKQVDKSGKFLKALKEYRKQQEENNEIIKKSAIDEAEVTFENEPHYRLSELGGYEMRNIAKRFRDRYPSLFNKSSILSPYETARNLISVISSDRDRSIQSAQHFLRGVYESNSDEKADREFENIATHLSDRIDVNNRMMRLFDECDQYLKQVKKNQTAFSELLLFKNGQEIKHLIDEFKKRHDIVNMDVDPGIILKIFTLCNIESAHRMPENWCRLFVDEDYSVMSYLNDLKGYWMKSYGNEINSKMIYLVIKDLFIEMDKYIKEDSKRHKIILRFGHAENIFPFVTALGLFKDEHPLNSNNFKENLDRKFKSAFITPFSSNLAFVLHKCEDPASKNINHKVSVLLNELPIGELNAGQLECNKKNPNNNKIKNDGSLCDYEDLKSQLDGYINLHFNDVCQKNDHIKEIDDNLHETMHHASVDPSSTNIKLDL